MAVSGINNYQDVLYQWQGQQLKSTGSKSSSSSSSLINSLFNSTTSMTSQIASMIELTKYAMDAMGVSSDGRVTFSQITKYREQLQSQFNSSVKEGLAQSGINDVSALSFTLDGNGAITATGTNAEDRKKAQAWLDANPSIGSDLRKQLEEAGIEDGGDISFTVSSTGKITLVDSTTSAFQSILDADAKLTDELRSALDEMGVTLDSPIEFVFSDDGNLVVKGDHEQSEIMNQWLAENTAISDTIKKQLEKSDVHESAVSLRLGAEGNLQIHVNNADNNTIQEVFDNSGDIGKKIIDGLNSLGIDKNINFSIQVNEDGSITIISDHADRDKVQKFFEDNPELIKTFRQIETLAGIDDARQAMQVSPTEMRKRIQIESMASWWFNTGNSDYNSYFGNYASGNLSLLSGINLQV